MGINTSKAIIPSPLSTTLYVITASGALYYSDSVNGGYNPVVPEGTTGITNCIYLTKAHNKIYLSRGTSGFAEYDPSTNTIEYFGLEPQGVGYITIFGEYVYATASAKNNGLWVCKIGEDVITQVTGTAGQPLNYLITHKDKIIISSETNGLYMYIPDSVDGKPPPGQTTIQFGSPGYLLGNTIVVDNSPDDIVYSTTSLGSAGVLQTTLKIGVNTTTQVVGTEAADFRNIQADDRYLYFTTSTGIYKLDTESTQFLFFLLLYFLIYQQI